MSIKVEEVFSMVGGCDEYSYANNSRVQEKVIIQAKQLVEEAVLEICTTLLPKKIVVADLGCSSGPNTLLVLSEITNTIDEHYLHSNQKKPEIQFFLNDLPSNDFNNIFQMSAVYEKQVKQEKGDEFVPFYIVASSGSFYGRLFPSESVHFFHSSFCLMWLSQVPQGLEGENCVHLNKGYICASEESPPIVNHLYLEQFKRDITTFLESRAKELIVGGRMVLTFMGRRKFSEIGYFYRLLSDALKDMVSEGLVEEEKLDSFNVPIYRASMEEVKSIIEMEGSFHLIEGRISETNWDPFDKSTDNLVVDKDLSGQNVAKYARAITEPLLASHFGNKIMDDLFSRFAKNIAKHMSKGKPKFVVFTLFLKLKDESMIIN